MRPRRESRLRPTASVVIPSYGRPEQLQRLLTALLRQDVSGNEYEIVVVDDGSPNPTAEVISRLPESVSVSVKCFRKHHGGPAQARAFGAEQSRGQLLIFVDDDMLVGADFVREHIAAHREVGPAAVNCEFDWKVEARPEAFRRWYGGRVQEWTAARSAALRQIGDGLFEIPNVLLTTANLSVSKADYDRVGGFDEGYLFSCEDQDFGLRLAEAGVRAIVTTRTQATHCESQRTLRSVCRRQRAGARDTVRFMRRFSLLDRPDQARLIVTNDPIRAGVDSWRVVMKKMLKTVIASPPTAVLVFGVMALWGRTPLWTSGLARAYEFVVGAHLRKGWCQGRRMFGVDVAIVGPEGRARVA